MHRLCTISSSILLKVPRFSYLTSPSIGRKRVDSRLQTEGMVAFVTHVTHKHFGVLSWVSTQGRERLFCFFFKCLLHKHILTVPQYSTNVTNLFFF